MADDPFHGRGHEKDGFTDAELASIRHMREKLTEWSPSIKVAHLIFQGWKVILPLLVAGMGVGYYMAAQGWTP